MKSPESKPATNQGEITVAPGRDRVHAKVLDSDDLVGRVVAERYRVEALLGSGGMGTVYRAQHVHMRKTVALKLLHRPMLGSPEMVARFEREAIAAARIDHPHVAAATDCGRLESGLLYLVLEYVEGKSLQRCLAESGALPVGRALGVARQIASALGAAHAVGIVHRDLKPDNVMLVARGDQADFAKVLDFGIAKLALDENARTLTQMGSVFGTPEYMSPEQALGEAVDARSDLYSLGIVLYQMLSGRLPFAAEDPVSVLAQQMTAEPPRLPPSIAPPVADLVYRLLAKDVQSRPETADVVCGEIDRILTNLPRALEKRGVEASAHVGGFSQQGMAWVGSGAAALFTYVARRWVTPVRWGRHSVPTWVVASTITAVIGGGVMLERSRTHEAALGAAAAKGTARIRAKQVTEAAVAEDLGPGTDLATVSQRVEQIEALPVYKRSREDWVALARGQAELGHDKESVTAYRSVLKLDRSLRRDPVVLADLRRAGQSLDTYRVVVNFCEGLLGENGPELLYQLWLDTRGDPNKANIAEVVLKKLEILSLRASPALRVFIELEVGKTCEKLQAVLARAVTHADERSAEKLTELSRKTGCGPSQSEDCWPCLRGDDLLGEALERARSHPAPSLVRGRDSEH